jgi:hypothetical protein
MNSDRSKKMSAPPPYHLRPNKTVDRLVFLDAIRRYVRLPRKQEQYTYYTMGGPYLQDVRDMHDSFPEIKIVSIEEKEKICKRQKFHLPCNRVKIENSKMKEYIDLYAANDKKSIFWLDYTDLKYSNFEDFMALLVKVRSESIVKITLQAVARYYSGKEEEFRSQFDAILPSNYGVHPRDQVEYAALLQDMLRISAEKALSGATGFAFQPVVSLCYTDSADILTLTGVVCEKSKLAETRDCFKKWQLSNLDWRAPKKINVPFLSVKERLHLQKLLPCKKNGGKKLLRSLGHCIDETERASRIQLDQYAEFYKFYPHFIRANPQ